MSSHKAPQSTFAVRLRFNTSGHFFNHDKEFFEFKIQSSDNRQATLRSCERDSQSKMRLPINMARQLTLTVGGFPSESDAYQFASRLKSAVDLVGVILQDGIDTGSNKALGSVGESIRKHYEAQGQQALSEIHGFQIYNEEPKPKFISVRATLSASRPAQTFVDSVLRAMALADKIKPKEKLAIEIYNAAHFESSQESRFISLITAVECLAKPEKLPSPIPELVDELLNKSTYSEKLLPGVRDSFLGRLQELKKESIGKACERTIRETLGEQQAKTFKIYYSERSKLVHEGSVGSNFNTIEEVEKLDKLVADLILATLNTTTSPIE